MLQSPYLKSNPSLHIFLPIFYIVWSDAVLTPSEIKIIKDSIERQRWLSIEEKKFLLEQLNPTSPPSPDEFRSWLDAIRKAAQNLPISSNPQLVDIGIALAQLYATAPLNGAITEAKESLASIDETLGLIPGEVIYQFYPERRTTITEQQSTQSTFDVNTLAKILDGDQAEIIKKVKAVISDPEFRYLDTDNLPAYREKILQWCKQLADQGYGSMAYPKEFGGQGDMMSYFSIMETLSYHDLSLVIKFGVQFGLFGMSVYFLGTEKHHKKYLKQIGTLELPGCFAMTETGHGSNVKGIETTATYVHGTKSLIIHTPNELAKKEYIGNAAVHGQMATTFVKLIVDGKDYGVSAVLVPIRDKNGKSLPGITIEDCGRKMGLNGVDNGKIHFDAISVPVENLLDRFASINAEGKFESPIASDNRRFFTMLGTLVGGRIGIPRSGLSACKSGLTIAIRYGDQRKQFGPEGASEVPILNYRTHQRRLMPLLANAYALHFSLRYLTERFIARTENDMQEIEALAAGMKAFATWNTTDTLQECREACGGKGYLSENRIERLKNDTDIYTTFEGDNTVLLQLVAKSRLTEFKQEFSNMGMFGILNFVAEQASSTLAEMNPFFTRNTDEGHLLSFEFQLDAFKHRERDILVSAAQRLKRHISNGMDSFDAFNVSQHHLLEVGLAHIERVILEKFIQQVEQTKDAGCRTVLKKLCQLFALAQIEKNKGWYLESGYMEGSKTKAIRKLVNQLCWDVRQEAVPLVDAFKIPESCLAAPIARKK
jgi:acyl-CoA oxidase